MDVSNTVTPLGVAVFALKQNKLQLLAPVEQQAQHPEREQTRMKTDPPIEQVIRMVQPMGGALGISVCCDFQVSVSIEWSTFVIVGLRSDRILAWRR